MFCFKLYYLGNWWKIFLTRNGSEDFENIVNIWLLKYLMKLLGSKLYILNTFNFVSFWCGFALALWCWWLPHVFVMCDYPVFVTCDYTPSSWRQAKLEAPTLYDTRNSLSVWVRMLPIGPKDHIQKEYCVTRHSLLPLGGRGKSLSMWVRLGKPKRPHTKEVLYSALSPTAHSRIGKSFRLWVRLDKADKPYDKRGTYHASAFGF